MTFLDIFEGDLKRRRGGREGGYKDIACTDNERGDTECGETRDHESTELRTLRASGCVRGTVSILPSCFSFAPSPSQLSFTAYTLHPCLLRLLLPSSSTGRALSTACAMEQKRKDVLPRSRILRWVGWREQRWWGRTSRTEIGSLRSSLSLPQQLDVAALGAWRGGKKGQTWARTRIIPHHLRFRFHPPFKPTLHSLPSIGVPCR
jgi:hypothetical protein